MFSEVREACSVLEKGGIILYPTDTIWGIGCDALSEAAIRDVYMLKQRSDTKSLIILLADERDIFQYVADPHPDIIHLLGSFEQPTTVIYDQAVGLPGNLVNQDGSIAIRVTRDPFCKSLIKKLGRPVVSTSANISGQPAPSCYKDVSPLIKEQVDYIVDYRRDDPGTGRASRIIRITPDGGLQFIRK